MPYIFFGALIYVVFTGIEYMFAGYISGNDKKAKQEITGIITGMIFYFLMITVYNWFVCDVGRITSVS